MTSVRSHLQRLSGNRLAGVLLLFALFLLTGCASIRSGQKNEPARTEEDSDKPQVYNPVTGKYETVENPIELVDTVAFIEDVTVEPIESADEMIETKKSAYDIALLIPFDAPSVDSFGTGMDPNLRRFIHYYAGVRMALRYLNLRGIKLQTSVYDTKESVVNTERILDEIVKPDVIVGPYDIDELKVAEDYARKKHVPLFSPWTPSIPVEKDNPYFVQLLPGLAVHARAITNYIDTHFPGSHVFLTGRNDPRETGRFALYQDVHMENATARPYRELIVEDKSIDLNETALGKMLSKDTATIFILPHYSRRDEDFIASFLRKLHAEQGDRLVYVFGLPQWLSFPKLRPDYLESTNVHISSSFYVDYSDPDIQAFQRDFLERYGTLPEQSAFQGYDFFIYLGESLNRYGTGFLKHISTPEGANNAYRIEATLSTDVDAELKRPVHVYENRAIHILRFADQKFRDAGALSNETD